MHLFLEAAHPSPTLTQRESVGGARWAYQPRPPRTFRGTVI